MVTQLASKPAAWLSILALTAAVPAPAADDAFAHANRVLAGTILIDGNNDLPWEIRASDSAPRDVQAYNLNQPTKGNTDIARLRADQRRDLLTRLLDDRACAPTLGMYRGRVSAGISPPANPNTTHPGIVLKITRPNSSLSCLQIVPPVDSRTDILNEPK